MHLVLLGDSVFDNGVYVRPGEPDVVRQARALAPEGARVTLLAVDGHVTGDVHGQLAELPEDATHLALSVGGNDALGHLDVFSEAVTLAGQAFARLHQIREAFEESYAQLLDRLQALGRPLTVLSIYYPRFDRFSLERLGEAAPEGSGSTLQPMAMGALAAFNDAITHQAFRRDLPLVDLRVLCGDDRDFANPIEPSAAGGEKIARAVLRAATGGDSVGRVYARP